MTSENNLPLISIIVPIYNTPSFLPECIESAIGQTYQNIEVLLLNDGSTDSSPRICDSYAEKDERVRVFHMPNRGVACTRNTGLIEARGAYLLFLDSDDYMDREIVSALYKVMIDTDSDMVLSSYNIITETGDTHQEKPRQITGTYSGADFMQHIYDTDFLPQNIVLWGKLYKRELWQDVWMPENNLHDDEHALTFIIDRSDKITAIPQKLYYYRERQGSIMNTFNIEYQIKKSFDFMLVFNDRHQLFSKKGYDDLVVENLRKKSNSIRTTYKNIRNLDAKNKNKVIYKKRLKKEIGTSMKIYLSNKKVKMHRKVKMLIWYIKLLNA
ncbi:MAG: glycosyltransferase [Prevotella sp.]|jgi:glycosyltransferase involved in cell wall biosynthesis|nr:glycosyltransferase [Prevotella sp.]